MRIGKGAELVGPFKRFTFTVPLTVKAPNAVSVEAANGSVWNEVLFAKVMLFAVARPWRAAPALTVRSELLIEPARFNVPATTVVAPE